jgi:predicted RNA methylase
MDPYFLYKDGKISIDVLKFDQYYCKHEIATQLIKLIDLSKFEHIIEPCAGNGAFSLQIPNCEAYDIDPQHESIIKKDFWELYFEYDPETTLIIGGPPYGLNHQTATKFLERCTMFANTVAFILPKTFQNPTKFELVLEEKLRKTAFTAGGYDFAHPSSFQIYKCSI